MNETVAEAKKYAVFSESGRDLFFYFDYLILKNLTDRIDQWDIPIGALAVSKNHTAKWFFLVTGPHVFNEYLARYVDDPSLINKLGDFLTRSHAKAKAHLASRDMAVMDSRALIQFLFEYYEYCRHTMRSSTIIRLIDHGLINHYEKLFGEDVGQYLPVIMQGDKPSIGTVEANKLLLTAKEIKQKNHAISASEITKKLQRLSDEYAWLTCGYYTETAQSLGDYRRRLDEILESDPAEKLSENKKTIKENLTKRQKLLEKLSGEEQIYANIARQSAYLKDLYKFLINEIIFRSEYLFEVIAKKTGYSGNKLKDMLPTEVTALLQDKAIDEDVVDARIKHHAVFSLGSEITVVTGQEAERWEQWLESKKGSVASEWKGRIAMEGKARGIARVVLGPQDFRKLRPGEILVTITTSPDFLPIMRRAAGIVAEEGGITSHVAITSREMGIPAVIGLEGISSVITDGDLVEVDADKGVVMIVRKAGG